MSKRTLFTLAQVALPIDFENIGKFGQDATDDLMQDVIGYAAHWSAFTVAIKSSQEVTISPGRYLEGRIVYEAEESRDLNLTTLVPLAASDERWIALVARGQEVQAFEDRAVDTAQNPETSQTSTVPVPVVSKRIVNVVLVSGVPAPAPAQKPTIAETDACIAFVRLTTAGVQNVEPGGKWRAKTLAEVEGRVTSIELRVAQLFEDTESLRTDLGNATADIINLRDTIPDARVFEQIVRDTARLSQAANLPDEARNYFFDQALLPDFWDFTQGGYFRVREGVHPQYAAQKDQLLRLLNYDADDISVFDHMMILPAYTEVVRVTSPEGNGVKNLANTVHTITTATQHTESHQSIRYGETIKVCENTAGWGAVGQQKAGAVFQANGQTFVSKGETANPWNQTATAQSGHKEYAVQRVIKETYTSTYTTYNTETFGLSGALMGQTFLCSQVMVATSIDLFFTKVGATGDVTLALCEVNIIGAPDYSSVLSKVTMPRGSLVVGWNKFAFKPTLLDQGKRYAWFTVTSGNHEIKTVAANAFGGGSMFISSDGVWAQGSTEEDFTFRLNSAKFTSSRVVMQFEPIGSVENGMSEMEMIYQAWEPAATSIAWEVKAQGDANWVPMDARIDNPLANLPPLVQLRAIFIGTADVAPMIKLDQYARVVAGRMRPDMRAISKLQAFGFGTDEAQIVVNMDNFNSAKHSCAPKIVLSGGTVVSPDAVITQVDPAKPSRTKFTANFTLPANTLAARVRLDTVNQSVIDTTFVQDVQLNAF